ncbi:hypothetical protein LguiA_022476 [Lonicera macranthoides]
MVLAQHKVSVGVDFDLGFRLQGFLSAFNFRLRLIRDFGKKLAFRFKEISSLVI